MSRESKLAAGEHLGGVAPLGYRRVAGELVVEEGEAETVRAVFRCYLKEKSVARAASALEVLGFRSRRGARFSPASVAQVLRNVTYTGAVSLRGTIVQGKHAALVSADVFALVREQLRARDKHARVRLPEAARELERRELGAELLRAAKGLLAIVASGLVTFAPRTLAGAPIAAAVARIRQLRELELEIARAA